jgi:D-amino-acid dehydrogenase
VGAPAVVVVGSGVAGAAAAFSLSRAGAAVTVVDGQSAGAATPAGAGIVQPWAADVEGPFYGLYAAGAAHYPELVGQLAGSGAASTGYAVCGSLVVDDDPARLDAVESRVRARTAGVPLAG